MLGLRNSIILLFCSLFSVKGQNIAQGYPPGAEQQQQPDEKVANNRAESTNPAAGSGPPALGAHPSQIGGGETSAPNQQSVQQESAGSGSSAAPISPSYPMSHGIVIKGSKPCIEPASVEKFDTPEHHHRAGLRYKECLRRKSAGE